MLWISNNQLKVDRIYRDRYGEKKKIKIGVNLVNLVQKRSAGIGVNVPSIRSSRLDNG